MCAIGVGCLYLAPSLAGSPDQLGVEPAGDDSTGAPVNSPSVNSPGPTVTGATATVDPPAEPSTTPYVSGADGSPTDDPGGQRRPARGATAYDPNDTRDHEPPTAVETIRPANVTPRRLSLTWAPAADNVGVVGYRIWVNGFAVATTAETRATVRWFNDDSGQHVVQVRAIDAEGNESATSPSLTVTRPSTEPKPTDTPTSEPPAPSESAEPTPEPSTSVEPSADPSQSAEANSTTEAPQPTESPTA